MLNLFSRAISHISSLLNGLQVKRFLAVVLVGFLLLTTNVNLGRNNRSLNKTLDDTAHQIDSERPKTTGEWKQEARETEGAPGERLKNIAEESAQAVKEWGSLYPDTAERSARQVRDNVR